MALLIYILLNLLIIALFVYSKLTPHKARLGGKFLNVYTFCERIFEPVLNLLRRIAKPIQVGTGLAVDMSQILLLLILLLLLKYFL